MLGKGPHDLGKAVRLGRRDPVELDPIGVDADVGQQMAQHGEPLGGSMIATNIVAVADVSAKDHHPIGALAKGADYQLGRDPT